MFDRAPRSWHKRFILNCEKVIKSGDPYAVKMFVKWGKAAMPV
jgi:hypothetical protein